MCFLHKMIKSAVQYLKKKLCLILEPINDLRDNKYNKSYKNPKYQKLI